MQASRNIQKKKDILIIDLVRRIIRRQYFKQLERVFVVATT